MSVCYESFHDACINLRHDERLVAALARNPAVARAAPTLQRARAMVVHRSRVRRASLVRALALTLAASVTACAAHDDRKEPERAASATQAVTPPASPRFNDVFIKATHNSYWTNKVSSTVDATGMPLSDPGAAGTWMRLWDQLAHEHVRSIELDLHRDIDLPYANVGYHPGEFRVYHTNIPDNSTCFNLEDCLQILQRFDYAVPNHEVIHIALELKQVDRLTFDDGLFDDPNFSPQELDRVLWEHLGPRLYTPGELMSQCDHDPDVGSIAALRDCAKRDHVQWPTLDELRGRFIVTVHGTETPAAPGACNERSWWQYASGDIRRHAAFPMFVVQEHLPGTDDASLPDYKATRYNTPTDAFRAMWRRALDNTIFWDLEDPQNIDFVDPHHSLQTQFHGIVRPAAAHLIDHDVPSCDGIDCVEDNVGSIRQDHAVTNGWHILMTDYPVNFITDFKYTNGGHPMTPDIPSRVDYPMFEAADVDPTQARRFPREAFREPGSRVYLDVSNRVLGPGGTYLHDALASSVPPNSALPPGAAYAIDPKHGGQTFLARNAPPRASEPIEDWEAFPSTSMVTHSQGPLELTPWGGGCLEAATSTSLTQGDHVQICRVPGATDDRPVDVTVDVWSGTTHLYSNDTKLDHHIIQGASMGEAIRMRVDRSGGGTVVTLYTAAEAGADGSMRWIPYPHAPFVWGSDLSVQGIRQSGDAVLLGTRLNGAPIHFADFAPPTVGYAYDLSYCGQDGKACAPRSFEKPATIDVGGVHYVPIHEARGKIYGGQDRTLYTASLLEAQTGGLPNVVPSKFLLRADAPDSTWKPVYRCVDWRRDMHVYWLSTSPACNNSGDDPGQPNGILGYLSTVSRPNTVPLYHMREGTENATGVLTNTPEHDTHDHYFAAGDADRAKVSGSYSLFETLGYVTVPTPPAGTIAVDATALSEQQISVYAMTPFFDSKNVEVVTLAAGPYAVYSQAQGAIVAAFTVQKDGTVAYDASLEGAVFTGRGTATLHVVAHRVVVDGRAASSQGFGVSYLSPWTDASVPIQVDVAAGPYAINSQAQNAPLGSFRVKGDGTIDFDTSLDATFAGRGTATLTIRAPFTVVDGTTLTPQPISIEYVTPFQSSATAVEAHLAPGPYQIGAQACGGPLATFRWKPDGTVDYDASFDGVLAGRNATTVGIVAHPVTIDARALVGQGISVGYVNTSYVPASAPLALRLASCGGYLLYSQQKGVIGAFRVKSDGTFDFDAAYAAVFAGRGTTTLRVLGD